MVLSEVEAQAQDGEQSRTINSYPYDVNYIVLFVRELNFPYKQMQEIQFLHQLKLLMNRDGINSRPYGVRVIRAFAGMTDRKNWKGKEKL